MYRGQRGRVEKDGIEKSKSPLSDDEGGGGGSGGGGNLPEVDTENDILYWDGSEWSILAAPSNTGTWIMGVVDGVIEWIGTETCDSGDVDPPS